MRRSRRKRDSIDLVSEVSTSKLVHGGQALGVDTNGKTTFVWGAIPDERVRVQITRNKKSWAEGIALEVIEASPYRITPEEPELYLGTSPWQIIKYVKENVWKQTILTEVFASVGLEIKWQEFYFPKSRYHYRNKMEYSFWWEDGRIDLALHARGSHKKIAVAESILASNAINTAGAKLIDFLNKHSVGGKDMKSVIIRSTAKEEAGLAVYVKQRSLSELPWKELKVELLRVYYSEPKSPASVPTELLVSLGQEDLHDTLLGKEYRYACEGFFQVNIAVYEVVLRKMSEFVSDDDDVVDMYAGVGTIGMSLPHKSLVSIELDKSSSKQAKCNAEHDSSVEVVLSESESALDYIQKSKVILLDPPRAGLHSKVIDRLVSEKPKKIIYLSCNPSTQARDVRLLIDGGYTISYAGGYNFFPATPHIESLIVLELSSK